MKIRILKSILTVLLCAATFDTFAQVTTMPDTTNLYGERRDSLKASVKTARQNGNFLSKGKDIRTEVISAAGLCKMACCNLAESFENSASVTVGYSDAVTGARQIRLLGQSGIYTQMLDENRPVMRGLSAPWGLTFVPSQWLESIQIAKGVTSVINGVESMTGQINMEHRKPTDEKPLFLQGSFMSNTRWDLNATSSLQLDKEGKWSTILLAHSNGNIAQMDENKDGFLDDPNNLNISLSNRWLYYGNGGNFQVRFGVRGIYDKRVGGQPTVTVNGIEPSSTPWQSDIANKSLGGYVKIGTALNDDNSRNMAIVADYTYYNMDAGFGNRNTPFFSGYAADQHSVFVNALYQDQALEEHHFTIGANATGDIYGENFTRSFNDYTGGLLNTSLWDYAVFGEYTYRHEDKFSAILGLRGDWYNTVGARFSPRLTLRYTPVEQLVLRANGGRGLRYSNPLVDNIGTISTGKFLSGDIMSHPLEDAWTFGGNATWYLPFDKSGKTYLSVDYFHTLFTEQLLVDYWTPAANPGIVSGLMNFISFYTLSSVENGRSTTDNVQVDFSSQPFDGFTVTLTGRYTDARQTLKYQESDVKPMTSRYKAVLNLQYATNLNKWIFDFTASLNGPCRVWDFMKGMNGMYENGYTPVYPLLYAQITKRFKGFDIYIGGENLTNYTQPNPIINADTPYSTAFDASCIWGPLMGVSFYAGFRVTLWKKA